ncbi:hypothetical protein GCM10012275_57000 [Longimycelium tulufanense]|uniref:Uncharacterized protein n=1 Tax=Longimycelium tulufanense TaxID=907463 RepID=A0A8J3CHP6_9PSEU|nr:hypothetical protein [Longimycelium tulufanense]GGM78958.1 hypothetical protein GCM10012275_57000 [Longimycelium tulufanense]
MIDYAFGAVVSGVLSPMLSLVTAVTYPFVWVRRLCATTAKDARTPARAG